MIKQIKLILAQVFCFHNYVAIENMIKAKDRNIGDSIYVQKCTKCGVKRYLYGGRIILKSTQET